MTAKTRPCEICMKPIEAERLETIPETRLCLEHVEKIKKYGGEFVVTSTLERTSKPDSIKINFGGVTPKMTRNHKGIEKLKDDFEEEKWQKKD